MAGLRGLVQAMEDDLDWIEIHSRLAARARDWDEGGRPDNRLMSGPDIAAAKRLIETRRPTAPEMLPVQLDFIQVSEAHEQAQRSARERDLEERRRLAEDALAQSRRVVRLTRAFLAGALVLLGLAAGAGWFAWKQREQSVQAATEASIRQVRGATRGAKRGGSSTNDARSPNHAIRPARGGCARHSRPAGRW